jgi:hypothetical protein
MTGRPGDHKIPAGQPPDLAGTQRHRAPGLAGRTEGQPGRTEGQADGATPVPVRDRDPSGRPRNARPRDALGRPLPHGETGEQRIPDDLAVPPAEALGMAQRLLDSGRPFHAHEVLEASWKAAPPAERELWRGLAQIAVGLTHIQRGNAPGATALLRRGGQRVGGYAGTAPHGIDAGGIARQAAGLADRIDAGGIAAAGDRPGFHLTAVPQRREHDLGGAVDPPKS